MARRASNRIDQGDADWHRLSHEFPEHTKASSLYAIPARLIERIKAEAPNLFSPEDLEFEAALNAGERTGFFRGQSFTYALLRDSSVLSESADEVQQRLDADLQRMTEEQVRDAGGGDQELNDLRHMRQRLKEEIALRQRAFAGWLVTDAGFHLTRQEFQTSWKADYERRWPYELLPPKLLDLKPDKVSKEDLPFFTSYLQFCQMWNLRALLTWELPTPVDPGIVLPTVHSLYRLGNAGCQFFVPWYLARDERLTLFDIMGPAALTTKLDHLGPWLNRTSKNFSLERFAAMLPLYVYLELAIKSRYESRLYGNTAALDRALGQFIKNINPDSHAAISVEDTVKKIRMKMSERLKECENAVDEVRRARKRRETP